MQVSGRVSMQSATHLCFVVWFIFFASSKSSENLKFEIDALFRAS